MLNRFLEDFNTINKLILQKEKLGLTFKEAIQEIIEEEFLKVGLDLNTSSNLSYLEFREKIKDNFILRYLHAINLNISDNGLFCIVKYNPNFTNMYSLYHFARSLVVTRTPDNVEIVTSGFTKFYNLGENDVTEANLEKLIQKEKFAYIAEKLDGVNITIRKTKEEILVNTVGLLSKEENIASNKNPIYATYKLLSSDKTTKKMVESHPEISFIFELIGFQEIIVNYKKEQAGLYLIGARRFLNSNGTESEMLTQEELDKFSEKYKIKRSKSKKVYSAKEALDYVNSEEMKGQEGVVLYVGKDIYKLKRKDYVMAHNLKRLRYANDPKSLDGFVKLLVPLIVYDNLDDYIGIFKGNVPDFISKSISMVKEDLNEFNFKILGSVERSKNISDSEFKELCAKYPEIYRNIMLVIRQNTDYRPELCDILITKNLKNIAELPEKYFERKMPDNKPENLSDAILSVHLQTLYGISDYASEEFMNRSYKLKTIYMKYLKENKNVVLRKVKLKNGFESFAVILKFGTHFELIFTPSSVYTKDSNRQQMYCIFNTNDDMYTLDYLAKATKKYKQLPFILDIYDGRRSIKKWI